MILIGSNLTLPEWSEALRMEPHEYYDDAILGYDPQEDRLIYNEDKIIDILITKEGMSVEDAIEWYDYNICGTQGEHYPNYIIPAG
jgi:hypothetical protein